MFGNVFTFNERKWNIHIVAAAESPIPETIYREKKERTETI
jgi:hypothetical protein